MLPLPIDPSSLTRWRKRIGKEGSEKILALTIQAGIRTQVIRKFDIKRVIVDTTVQEKNIAFPRDSQLYLTALKALTQLAKDNGILLRQTYTRKAKVLSFQISRYAHAKQFKRMKKSLKTLKCYLGRVYRDILRQINTDLRNAPKTIAISPKNVLIPARKAFIKSWGWVITKMFECTSFPQNEFSYIILNQINI